MTSEHLWLVDGTCKHCGKLEDRAAEPCRHPWQCPQCRSCNTGDAAAATYCTTVCKDCGYKWDEKRSGAMSEKCSSATLCPRCGKCDQWEVDLTRCAGCGVMCCDDCIAFRAPVCDPPNGDFLCDECDQQNGQVRRYDD